MTRRLLEFLRQEPPKEFLDRIPVESRGQVRVIPVDSIDYITASGPYAELHASDKTYAVRERMQTLEEDLRDRTRVWFSGSNHFSLVLSFASCLLLRLGSV